ncbi:MAG: peptidoglycan recognition family protein [Candidatus Pedobacter colombiensis]|uniref:N-acetylmuramoyl-L-alanine amidase n=1 Tax=Candidatus Pedobacter colombiensis TaxID=3121371 RepID=A0AAJ5W6N2_9SPHI|nr:peptidoglycan recognition family protein [Pedobacter sp.]WEK19523.1 MAG: peptidoglycan recognition family protein [Pedobacter sp.]
MMIKRYATRLIILILLCSTASLKSRAQATFRIFDKPIIFDAERKRLSLEYLEKRHGLKQDQPTIKPVMVVLHWTDIPTIEQTFDAFNKSRLPGARKEIAKASALNVSSQFLIDSDGTIFRLLPDTIFARHVIGLNYCAIGVENIGSDKNPLTPAQLVANEELIRYLKRKYPIEYVIGHYEYTRFKGTALWKESDPAYNTEKTDPGVDFMKRIREQIKDLNIKGAPDHK